MILAARRCSTRVALTVAPARSGVPVETSAPSPTISTSPSSTVAPGSPSSFSTAITSSLATVYCLPPVRITANMTGPIPVAAPAPQAPPAANKDRAGLPARERRTIVVRLSLSMFSGNVFGPLEPVRDVARTARLDRVTKPSPLAPGRGGDRAILRQGRDRRAPGDRRRAGAPGADRGGRPDCQPVAAVGGAKSDRGARAGSGG